MQPSNPFLFFFQALLGFMSVLSKSPALYAQCQLSSTRFGAAKDPEGISTTMTFTDHFSTPGGATVSLGGLLSAWAVQPWDNSIKEDLQRPPGSGHGGNAKMQSANPFLVFIQALLGLLSVSSESPALYAQCQLSSTRFGAAKDPEGISTTMTFTDHFCTPGGATVSSGGLLSAWAVPP
ncbi:hypothetical protein MRX96_007216 [Rhipicephalus microplus]